MDNLPLLETKNLSVNYGTVEALKNVSFYINEGEIIALLGSNGAGKSTALKAVCGLLEANNGRIISGDVKFQGKTIKNIPPYELVKKGLSLVPEGRKVFPSMTVRENLEMGAYTLSNKSDIETALKNVFSLFPKLKEREKQKAGTLSSGEQQMLTIGRALMLKPKLLLLDEPSLGLSPNFINIVFEKLKEINKSGTTILLVEQNVKKALQYCNRAYIFSLGEIKLEGNGESLLKDERVKGLFLGK
jgi:branched-chain amino acid transport system ATP-binding protein